MSTNKTLGFQLEWGHWRLNTKTYVLEFRNGYEVDLESCTTAAEILDWILQITRKSWTTAEDIGNLIRALGEIAPGGCFGLQGLVCPLGVPPDKPKPHVDFKKIIL